VFIFATGKQEYSASFRKGVKISKNNLRKLKIPVVNLRYLL